MKKTRLSTNVKKNPTTKRYYLTLNMDEHMTLLEMTKTLGMSKSKIVKHMILKNSDYILCNTVEIMKTLDFLGLEISKTREIIQPLIPHYLNNVSRESGRKDDLLEKDQALNKYFDIQIKIEHSMRDLLKTIKQMK